jgi:hypothetical protein
MERRRRRRRGRSTVLSKHVSSLPTLEPEVILEVVKVKKKRVPKPKPEPVPEPEILPPPEPVKKKRKPRVPKQVPVPPPEPAPPPEPLVETPPPALPEPVEEKPKPRVTVLPPSGYRDLPGPSRAKKEIEKFMEKPSQAEEVAILISEMKGRGKVKSKIPLKKPTPLYVTAGFREYANRIFDLAEKGGVVSELMILLHSFKVMFQRQIAEGIESSQLNPSAAPQNSEESE